MTGVMKKQVQLEGKDLQLMRTLCEEVEARLKEMSLLFSRVTKVDIGKDPVLRFRPEFIAGSDPHARPLRHIEIVCTPEGCGCYVDPPGICEYPCGAA